MKRLMFLLAFGAGYVAGSAAGRERYEQIRRVTLRVKEDPRVQQKAHEAAEFAKEHASAGAEKAKDAVMDHLPGGDDENTIDAGAFHASTRI